MQQQLNAGDKEKILHIASEEQEKHDFTKLGIPRSDAS